MNKYIILILQNIIHIMVPILTIVRIDDVITAVVVIQVFFGLWN